MGECVNVYLGETFIQTCRTIATRGVLAWRAKGIKNHQIKHSLDHPHPAIPPQFATEAETEKIVSEVARIKNIAPSVVKLDGINISGLVNVGIES